jgi:hypothetical protein
MAAHKDWKEMILEYGIVIVLVGMAAGGGGIVFGTAHYNYWKNRAEASEGERDIAIKALAPSLAKTDKLQKDVVELEKKAGEANASLQEKASLLDAKQKEIVDKDALLAGLQGKLNGKDQEIDRLKRQRMPPPASQSKPQVTANTFVKVIYRDGYACVYSLVREFGVAVGFVQTQFDSLREAGIIEATGASKDWDCVRFTSTGRAYAEQNGLN